MTQASSRAPSKFEQAIGILLSTIAILVSGGFCFLMLAAFFGESSDLFNNPNELLLVLGMLVVFGGIFIYSIRLFRRFCFTKPEPPIQKKIKPTIELGLIQFFAGVGIALLIYEFSPIQHSLSIYLVYFMCFSEAASGVAIIYIAKKNQKYGS